MNQSYQDMHDAAEARVATHAVGEPLPEEPSRDGYVETPITQAGFPKPELGSWPSKELSIERQNRLNVAKDCLIANLEHCPPEDKANRMITPWSITEFERMLVEGAVYDDGPGPDYQPPPADLPGGP